MPRRLVTVCGIVQGVGFRPFVARLARQLGLVGFVRNQGGNVVIAIEGEEPILDRFLADLNQLAPPRANINELMWHQEPERGECDFSIASSETFSTDPILISPDLSTCVQCLTELFNPLDRRYHYPFSNCTNCGPRLTILTEAPYDRPRTTMSAFAMCPACTREYENPSDRRFHAQPIACPACGPQLLLLDSMGTSVQCDDPLHHAALSLVVGQIAAIKGLGGYHLVCNARSSEAVSQLRQRKRRHAQPLAIMLRNLVDVRRICHVSAEEEALLTSPACPIVLLRTRLNAVAPEVAPRTHELGVMLPYSPLHHLLLNAVEGCPLVVTSGNCHDEPIVYDDRDAIERLGSLADFVLTHDRPIQLRCDDSVLRVVAGRPSPLRRARGYAPAPLPLPQPCRRPILALGGQLKSTFALGRDRQAILSHHLGNLDYLAAYRAYVDTVCHFEQLFDIEPALLVHDLHPDYATTRYALERDTPIERLAVQHHHAHLASCLAEHCLSEPAIGVIFDGTGLGADGAIWGGEFLVGGYDNYRRAAHLRYVPMPGGERAVREPWRMALAHLIDADVDCQTLIPHIPPQSIDTVRRMVTRQFNAHATSSMGRLFDAVAALVNQKALVEYEGQAAVELEWQATDTPLNGHYPFELIPATVPSEALQVDTRPLIAAAAYDLKHGESAANIARRFHSTVIEIIAQVCAAIARQSGLNVVVLSGGVFMNALLTRETESRLQSEGFRVYRHQLVPPNDGGLCLGQLAIAAARDSRDNSILTSQTNSPASAVNSI